jgi:hypothetical protein
MGGEEKLQYIQEFEEIEAILLDYEEIKKNMAKRSVAKLMLNSLRGKLTQRSNLPKTVICLYTIIPNTIIKGGSC